MCTLPLVEGIETCVFQITMRQRDTLNQEKAFLGPNLAVPEVSNDMSERIFYDCLKLGRPSYF